MLDYGVPLWDFSNEVKAIHWKLVMLLNTCKTDRQREVIELAQQSLNDWEKMHAFEVQKVFEDG